MKPIEKLKQVLLYGGVESNAYNEVRPELMQDNRNSLLVFSAILIIATSVMEIVSFIAPSLEEFRVGYGATAAFTLVLFLLLYFKGKDNSSLVNVLMYIFLTGVLGFGILLGTTGNPNEITASFIALLLAAPQLFNDRPIKIHILILGAMTVFITAVLALKNPITWSSDIINCIAFGILSMVISTYSIHNRVVNHHLEGTIRFMAENDQLTGLKNRNSYEKSLRKASILEANSIYCVYVDVNGLHELNNTQGHDAGDRMLQYIATAMQNIFGKSDTYRIGGDEYVALGINQAEEELKEKAAMLKSAVETAGYHIAIGISRKAQVETSVDNVVKEAEKKMYEDKAAYYRDNKIDRRRNRTW